MIIKTLFYENFNAIFLFAIFGMYFFYMYQESKENILKEKK